MDVTEHKGRRYLFLIYRDKIFENKDLKAAFQRLPEQISTTAKRVQLCPSDCFYVETLPELTFYQKSIPIHESHHPCTPKERKSCLGKAQDTKIPFEVQWMPHTTAQEKALEEDSRRWIAFLIDLKTHSIAAAAEGTISELQIIEVHPGYRNQGLCTLFVWKIFRELRKWKMTTLAIHNAAGKIGERCYRQAGKLAELSVRCEKQHTNDDTYCSHMLFQLI